MIDLFDVARPVRDATMRELERCLDPRLPVAITDGHRLGVHLVAVVMAYTSQKLRTLRGEVNDEINIHALMAIAAAQLVAHAAASFRPVHNGTPLTPSQNAVLLLRMIAANTMQQMEQIEAGAQDFVVPFELGETGALQPKAFDFVDLLKKEKP